MTRWPARLAPPVIATETIARYWWQSRSGLRDPPDLVDLAALAAGVRRTWQAPDAGAQETANETKRPRLRIVRNS